MKKTLRVRGVLLKRRLGKKGERVRWVKCE